MIDAADMTVDDMWEEFDEIVDADPMTLEVFQRMMHLLEELQRRGEDVDGMLFLGRFAMARMLGPITKEESVADSKIEVVDMQNGSEVPEELDRMLQAASKDQLKALMGLITTFPPDRKSVGLAARVLEQLEKHGEDVKEMLDGCRKYLSAQQSISS